MVVVVVVRRPFVVVVRRPQNPQKANNIRKPTRRTLHNVIILVQFFNFFIKNIIKNHWKTIIFHISPRRELRHWRRGWGWGGGPFRTKHPKNLKKSQKTVRTKIVHTSVHFSKNVKEYLQNIFIYTENDNESDKRI